MACIVNTRLFFQENAHVLLKIARIAPSRQPETHVRPECHQKCGLPATHGRKETPPSGASPQELKPDRVLF
jgi:hypothetical protein